MENNNKKKLEELDNSQIGNCERGSGSGRGAVVLGQFRAKAAPGESTQSRSNYLKSAVLERKPISFLCQSLLNVLFEKDPCIQMRNTPACFSPVGTFIKVIQWRHLLVGTPIPA